MALSHLAIIVMVISSMVILWSSLFLVTVYGSPTDEEAKLPKVIVVLAFWLLFAAVLLVPYDVYESQNSLDPVDSASVIATLWEIVYMLLALFLSFLIPFALFFYESDPGQNEAAGQRNCCDTQLGYATRYGICWMLLFISVLAVLFMFTNMASIPVVRVAQSSSWVVASNEAMINNFIIAPNNCPTPFGGEANLCIFSTINWDIPVTLPVFIIAVLSFSGWWCLVVFGGVGLFALPLDLINQFRTRAQPMARKEYIDFRMAIGSRVEALMQVAEDLLTNIDHPDATKTQKKKQKQTISKLQKYHALIKHDITILDEMKRLRETDLWRLVLNLVLGTVSLTLSMVWAGHITLFMLPSEPIHDFLNMFLVDLEGAFNGNYPWLGVFAYAVLAYYLMWCVVVGNFKVGVRLLWWRIYPMEVNNTMMNAFLVNVWFMLLSLPPIMHFCVEAMPAYAMYTDIDMIFGTQVHYLKVFSIFFELKIFLILMMALAILTMLYLVFHPANKALEIEAEIQALRELREELANKSERGSGLMSKLEGLFSRRK